MRVAAQQRGWKGKRLTTHDPLRMQTGRLVSRPAVVFLPAARCRGRSSLRRSVFSCEMSNSKKPICVVGSVNADLVVTVPRLPAPGETLAGGGGTTIPGMVKKRLRRRLVTNSAARRCSCRSQSPSGTLHRSCTRLIERPVALAHQQGERARTRLLPPQSWLTRPPLSGRRAARPFSQSQAAHAIMYYRLSPLFCGNYPTRDRLPTNETK